MESFEYSKFAYLNRFVMTFACSRDIKYLAWKNFEVFTPFIIIEILY